MMSAELLPARRKGTAWCIRHDTGRTETYGPGKTDNEANLSKITMGRVELLAGFRIDQPGGVTDVHAAT